MYLANGQSISADTILVNCAPATLHRLLGKPYQAPIGSQIKINIVMRRLPRFRSGIEPAIGFAGTASQPGLCQVAGGVRGGAGRSDPGSYAVRDLLPYPDRQLDPGSGVAGCGLPHSYAVRNAYAGEPVHRGSSRFAGGRRMRRCAPLRTVLAEPLEPCVARDRRGEPCIEVMTPSISKQNSGCLAATFSTMILPGRG